MRILFQLIVLLIGATVYSQNNKTSISAQLLSRNNTIDIEQQITYYNKSKDTLREIVLRNWANSYSGDDTPLAKRLLEDRKTAFYFAPEKGKGHSKINSIKCNDQKVNYHAPHHQKDLIYVNLPDDLKPNDSVVVSLKYIIKTPNARFTGSGKKGIDYYLQDWYISMAPYHHKWILDTHNNLNYQYNPPTDYQINFKVPIGYQIHSNFTQRKFIGDDYLRYNLTGKNYTKADISITFLKSFLDVDTKDCTVKTNFISEEINLNLQKEKIQQMMTFLQSHLETLPHQQLLIERETYIQNPIYELKYLPNIMQPYEDLFKWEIMFFKVLAKEYTEQTIINNKNTDYWLTEGLSVYLFIQYIEKYYPDAKILGKLADVWGIRKMNIAKSKFTDKFSITHQVTARENKDQSLNTPLKDLSNYNKKVVSPYKSGLGFIYLENFIGKETLASSIKKYISKNINKPSSSIEFLEILQQNTPKDISWFEKEWINTNKKIDHKIVKADFKNDSVYITLKNKRSINTPVALYGLKNNKIYSKIWIDGFNDTKKITIKNDSLDRVILNYENIYPEINTQNNWKNKNNKFFEKPLQILLLKDLNAQNRTQVFLNPEASYNYYDGVILGLGIQNKAYIRKNFEYKLKPTFSTASSTLTGGANFSYTTFPEKTNIHSTSIGISGSNYHYTKDLNYNVFSPHFTIRFKPKNLRAVGQNKITTRFLAINKEVADGETQTDEDVYNLFKTGYVYKKHNLITSYNLNISSEVATKFTKLTADFRYKHLTNNKRPIELRFYGGVFLRNHTTTDYFSFNQHTPNDYLFELPYLGRSETSGFLTQQYFKAEGGFVTQNEPGYANQWLTSINTNIGIWRWIETFNNISLLKNRNSTAFLDYEGGIRLNFIPDILELYLPVYSKEGIITKQDNYWENIRFTITLKAQPIVKFLKQQLF